MRDRFSKLTGGTRFVVSRLFLHLAGQEVAPILGVLNSTARAAIDSDGDLEIMGEGLVELCQTLLQYDEYWLSAANEGDVFWDEGEAGDYVNELFTDSAQRYLSEPDFSNGSQPNDPLSIPVTRNVVVMITVAFEGEVPELETDLSNVEALKDALKALINLHYKEKIRAIQVHFSPAQLGDELTNDQLLQYFTELIPL
ncbi:membrane protein [Aliterella atlantica CENA595]|uniref:Membrane protein n=1 Tax=Aliterella atlantica CENA595 TaxID=1618023 RepID=A0A0D8ZQT3_9CYAN|nr:membrane protein [Aliterella atlantica CENA595]